MMTIKEMKNIDIRTVNRDDLVDIRDVTIDTNLSHEERLKSFVQQIKNPYCFKYEDVVVKMSFSDTDITLENRIEQYLRTR